MRSLKEEPHAFGKPYEKAINEPDETYQQHVLNAFNGNTSWMFFAQQDDKLIGIIIGAILRDDPNAAGIFGVYVVPEARGKGISKRLMKKMLDELKSHTSIHRIKLTVNKNQTPAVNLYTSFGFAIVGEEKAMLGDGKYYDEYCMELLTITSP